MKELKSGFGPQAKPRSIKFDIKGLSKQMAASERRGRQRSWPGHGLVRRTEGWPDVPSNWRRSILTAIHNHMLLVSASRSCTILWTKVHIHSWALCTLLVCHLRRVLKESFIQNDKSVSTFSPVSNMYELISFVCPHQKKKSASRKISRVIANNYFGNRAISCLMRTNVHYAF